MKKIAKYLSLLIIIISLFTAFAMQSSAANPFGITKITVELGGDTFKGNLHTDGTITLTDYSSTRTDVVLEIPATYDGYTITGLGAGAFSDDSLKKVILPDTITSITYHAFSDCENLESIVFGDMSNETFEKGFIENCPALKNITFGDLKDFTFDANAFTNVPTLESVTFGNCENVTVKNYAFAKTAIKNIEIPEGVSLGQYVFSECTNLETAVINGAPLHQVKVTTNSAGVETRREDVYSEYLFNGCSNLKEVYLSSSYTKIYNSMFYECFALEKVTADYITEIGSKAFYRCKSLKKLELKNEVTIDDYSFQNCIALEYIDFSKIAMNYVPSYAFYGCSSLNNIDLSNKNGVSMYSFYGCKALSNLGDFKPMYINQYAFYECENLTHIDFSRLEEIGRYGLARTGFTYVELTNDYELGEGAFAGCNNLKEVYIAETITTGSYVFSRCENLERAVIGDEVVSVNGYDWFYHCENLKSIYIGKNFNLYQKNSGYQFAVNCLGRKGLTGLERYEVSPENPYYFTDDGVLYAKVEEYEYSTGKALPCTVVYLVAYPAGKTDATYSTKNAVNKDEWFTISEYAFYESQYLKELELTSTVLSGYNDVTVDNALVWSFAYSSVEKITFTDGCTFEDILYRMFYSSNLREFDFDMIYSLNDENKEVGGGVIEESAFENCLNLKSVSSKYCNDIDNYAFKGCISLEDVSFPNCTYLRDEAFYGCTSLKNVHLPELKRMSGPSIFQNCTSLESISLENLLYTYSYAFKDCVNLKTVYFPQLKRVSAGVFAGCVKLEKVNLENVTTIGEKAFSGCEKLTVLNLAKITNIYAYAFENCTGLTLIQFANNDCTFGENPFENCPKLEFFCEEDTSVYNYAIENNIPVCAVTINFQKNAYEYTGSEIEPSVIVSISGMTLVQNKDYVLLFEDNVERGNGRLTVQFIGDFEGLPDAVRLFSITKADIIVSQIDYVVDNEYSGEDIRPKVVVKYGGKVLVEDVDYTITYNSGTDAGSMFFTITGKGNYTGTIDCYYNIIRRNIAEATVSKNNDTVYTGDELMPKPVITWNGFTLVEGVDYTIEYFDNVNSGYGIMVIYGLGNFSGSQRVQFRIFGKNIENAVIPTIADQTYTGNEILPEISITLDGVILIKDVDYTVKYENNTEKGVATVVISGIGNYSGVAKQSFNIVKNSVYSFTVFSETEMTETYDGTELKPEIEVYFGTELLTEGVDYTISLENNVNAGTATVTVIGMGLYEGERSYNFTILPCEITENDISVSGNMEFFGSAVEPEISIIKNGTTLVEGEDYTVTYSNNNAVGTAYVTIEGKGNYCDTVNLEYEIYESEKDEEAPAPDGDENDEDNSQVENDTPVVAPEAPENPADKDKGDKNNSSQNNTNDNEANTVVKDEADIQNPVIPNTDGEDLEVFNAFQMLILIGFQLAIAVILSRKKKLKI